MSELPAAEKIETGATEKFFTTPLLLIFLIVFIASALALFLYLSPAHC